MITRKKLRVIGFLIGGIAGVSIALLVPMTLINILALLLGYGLGLFSGVAECIYHEIPS